MRVEILFFRRYDLKRHLSLLGVFCISLVLLALSITRSLAEQPLGNGVAVASAGMHADCSSPVCLDPSGMPVVEFSGIMEMAGVRRCEEVIIVAKALNYKFNGIMTYVLKPYLDVTLVAAMGSPGYRLFGHRWCSYRVSLIPATST